MGKASLILGSSKAGKTTSMRNLNPATTIMFSPLNKGLPFIGSGAKYTVWNKENNPKGNIIQTSSSKIISQWLQHISNNLPEINVAVIDDNTFVMAKELDRRRDEKSYDKFNDIAHDFLILAEITNSLRSDLNVYILHHTTTTGDGIITPIKTKAATFGKMIDEKLQGIESQFDIVFLAEKLVDDSGNILYKFKTRDANSSIGTPMGMFEDEYIDNDLKMIDERIRCYYNGNCEENTEKIVKIKK